MKKFLILAIIFAIVFSSVSLSVLGAEEDELLLDAAGVVTALGIMKGDSSGNLMPEKNITRAEMSTVL